MNKPMPQHVKPEIHYFEYSDDPALVGKPLLVPVGPADEQTAREIAEALTRFATDPIRLFPKPPPDTSAARTE